MKDLGSDVTEKTYLRLATLRLFHDLNLMDENKNQEISDFHRETLYTI